MIDFKFIELEEAKIKINSNESIVLDIRDKKSFDLEHIDGALNISNNNIDTFIENTQKDQSIIVYCYHGNSSQSIAKFLTDKGFFDVYSLNGGYAIWKENKK